jgi:hypothetical protein
LNEQCFVEIKEEPENEVSPPEEKEVKPARDESQMVSLLLESERYVMLIRAKYYSNIMLIFVPPR